MGNYCSSNSNPIVRALVVKYKITLKSARIIYDTARRLDVACREPTADLEYLEQQEMFMTVLNRYLKVVESNTEPLHGALLKSNNFDEVTKRVLKELNEEFDNQFEEDDIVRQLAKHRLYHINVTLLSNNNNESTLADLVGGARALDYLSNWAVDSIVHHLTRIATQRDIREEAGLPEYNTKIDYLESDLIRDRIHDAIGDEIDCAIENIERVIETETSEKIKQQWEKKIEALEELDIHLWEIIAISGKKFKQLTGVRITTNGVLILPKKSDIEDTHTIIADDENLAAQYDIDTSTISVFEKVKDALIEGLMVNEADKVENLYLLAKRLDVRNAINTMMRLTEGCTTPERMYYVFKNNVAKYPYLKVFVDRFSLSNPDTVADDEQFRTNVFLSLHKYFMQFRTTYESYNYQKKMQTPINNTANKKNVRSTMVYAAQGTFESGDNALMRGALDYKGKSECFAIRDEIQNQRAIVERTAYLKASNAYGELLETMQSIDFIARHQEQVDEAIAKCRRKLESAYSILHNGSTRRVKKCLRDVGVKVTNRQLHDVMEAYRTDNAVPAHLGGDRQFRPGYEPWGECFDLYRQIYSSWAAYDALFYYARECADLVGCMQSEEGGKDLNLSQSQDFGDDYPDKSKGTIALYATYNDIADLFEKYNSQKENSVWINDKMYYSWSEPMTAMRVLNDKVVTNGIAIPGKEEPSDFTPNTLVKRKADDLWTHAETVHEDLGGNRTDDPKKIWKTREVSYAGWLDMLDYIAYKEKKGYLDKTETANMTEGEIMMSMIYDYFYPDSLAKWKTDEDKRAHNLDYANYKMLIPSDKGRYGTIEAKKLSEKEALEQLHRFLSQELIRANDVIRFAVENSMKEESEREATISIYDVKETAKNKHVFDKLRKRAQLDAQKKVYEKMNMPLPKEYEIEYNKCIITCADVLYTDKDDIGKDGKPKKKYLFKNTGASLHIMKVLIPEIENQTELGQFIVDVIFNQKKPAYKNLLTDEVINAVDLIAVKKVDEEANKLLEKISELGLFETAPYVKPANSNPFGYDDFDNDDDFDDFDDDEVVAPKLDSKYFKMFYRSYSSYYSSNAAMKEGKEVSSYSKVLSRVPGTPTFDDKEAIVMYLFAHSGAMHEWDEKDYTSGKKDFDRLRHNYEPAIESLTGFACELNGFVLNNWIAKANMSEIFNIDLAFYGDTTNFQKRNADSVTEGETPDPQATVHGKPVSDGHYRTATLITHEVPSTIQTNVDVLFQKTAERIEDPQIRAKYLEHAKKTVDKLSKIDPTDGQGYVSLTGLRKRLAGLGQWSRSANEELDERGYIETDGKRAYIMTDEAIYRRFLRGEEIPQDYQHCFGNAEPQKPFVATHTTMKRPGRGESGLILVPTQFKDSEYALVFLGTKKSKAEPKSQLEALFRFMEETADKNPLQGIDAFVFDSAQKITATDKNLDIHGLTPKETLKALREHYKNPDKNDKENPYRNGSVTTYEVSEHHIVQKKNEHFRDSEQQIGVQMKVLAVSNLADDAVCELSDGTTISGKDLKTRYLKALKDKSERLLGQLQKDFGCDMPHEQRKMAILRKVFNLMHRNDDATTEFLKAFLLEDQNGVLNSALPLDDVSNRKSIEAMIYSAIRKAIYSKQRMPGGVVVQASSFGKSKDLSVRFKSTDKKDNGILKTYAEFKKDKRGTEEQIQEAYRKYCEKSQGGYAYFECEVPMPDHIRKKLEQEFGKDLYSAGLRDADGCWNMEKIRPLFPENTFDLIAYRTPTEGKHSAMVGKIVRFSPDSGGNIARFPFEVTFFTGSDFDIDTDMIEMRPYPGEEDYAVNSEIFELQVASLRSSNVMDEVFHEGSFEEWQQESYKITLRLNGWTEDRINSMTPKEIKERCKEVEDLDLMFPTTDMTLHFQNSDSKKMIGIAAVGVTSHAFFSLYNSTGNCLSVTTKGSFELVDDSQKDKKSYTFGKDTEIDMIYDKEGAKISLELKYVGAAADAAKDAALYRMNINKMTLPLCIQMHRMGIPRKFVHLIIAQPIVREVVEKARNNNKSFNTVLEEYIKLCKPYANTTDVRLTYSDLVNNISKYNNVPEGKLPQDRANFEYSVLATLQKVSKVQSKVRHLDNFTRYNSSNAMKDSSILKRYVMRERIEKLQEEFSTEDKNDPDKARAPKIHLPEIDTIYDTYGKGEMAKLCSMFPYIAEAIRTEDMIMGAVIEEMHSYSPVFWRLANQLLGYLSESRKGVTKEKKTKLLNELYSGYMNYMFFYGSNTVGDDNLHDRATFLKYTVYFNRDVYAPAIEEFKNDPAFYDEHIANNSFLQSLIPRAFSKEDKDRGTITTYLAGRNDDDIAKYYTDWVALLDHPKTRKLATQLAVHFLACRTGFSGSTPVSNMPVEIKKAIGMPDVIRSMDKALISDKQADDLLAMFQMHNTDEYALFPYVSLDKNAENDVSDKEEEEEDELDKAKNAVMASAESIKKKKKHEYTTQIDEDGNLVLKVTGYDEKTIGDAYFRAMPVFKLNEGRGKPTRFVKTIKVEVKDDAAYLTLEVVGKLGNHKVQEYRPASLYNGSLIAQTNEEDSEEYAEEVASTTDVTRLSEVDLRMKRGKKSGKVIEASPIEKEMSIRKDPSIFANTELPLDEVNHYAESEVFIQRLHKVADLLDLNISTTRVKSDIHRTKDMMTTNMQYAIQVTPDEYAEKDNVKLFAALASSIGYDSYTPVVKEYVLDIKDADTIEFDVKVGDTSWKNFEATIETITKLGYRISWDQENSILTCSHPLTGSSFEDLRNNFMQLVEAFDKQFDQYGAKVGGRQIYRFNLVRTQRLSVDDRIDTLNIELQKQKSNESINEETGDKLKNRLGRLRTKTERNKNGYPAVLRAAIERLEKSEVEKDFKNSMHSKEMRAAFEESTTPLQFTMPSLEATSIVESLNTRFEDDVKAEIANVTRSDAETLTAMITNTVNTVLKGTHATNEILGALTDTGLSGQTAQTVLNEINQILKDKNIC